MRWVDPAVCYEDFLNLFIQTFFFLPRLIFLSSGTQVCLSIKGWGKQSLALSSIPTHVSPQDFAGSYVLHSPAPHCLLEVALQWAAWQEAPDYPEKEGWLTRGEKHAQWRERLGLAQRNTVNLFRKDINELIFLPSFFFFFFLCVCILTLTHTSWEKGNKILPQNEWP